MATTDNHLSQLRVEQLAQLFRLLPLSLASSVVLALIVLGALRSSANHALMLVWFAALCACSAWRFAAWRRHRRLQASGFDLGNADHLAQLTRLRRVFFLGCLTAGILWGCTALFLYTPANMVLQLCVIFVLAGLTAGSTSSLAADRTAALAFQLPALLPFAARVLLQRDAVHVSMGIMVLVYAAFIFVSVHWIGRRIMENIALRIEAVDREEMLHESESHYREMALHDALTGLPNRHALQTALSQRLIQAQDAGTRMTLIYLDLDNFKAINDTRGHACGDALLAQIAQRLRRHSGAGDLLARVGGDEFVIARSGDCSAAESTAFASTLSGLLSQPWHYEGESINVCVSAGLSLHPEHGNDAETLLKRADMAMYEAKARGRNNYQLFAPEMSDNLQDRISFESSLAKAINNGELAAVYQPIVELSARRIVGLEALARWHDPRRGLISSATFIQIAEQFGLINALGEHVLRTVCAQIRDWTRSGVPLVPIAINVSPKQLHSERLPTLIAAVTAEFEVDPKLLQIEITESPQLLLSAHHIPTLQAIRSLGARVYFGTGHSSLSYLKQMPMDGLKIAQDFVQSLGSDARDTAIVGALVGIGRSLGVTVIAQGVESAQQANQLAAMGCDAAQGFYFHRPMAASFCRDLLRQFARHDNWTETLRRRVLSWARAERTAS